MNLNSSCVPERNALAVFGEEAKEGMERVT
jgi:hypothetical protein